MTDERCLFDRIRFSARRAWHRARLRRMIAGLGRPMLLTDIPGNVGDHLIWAGIEAAFGDLLPDRLSLRDAKSGRGSALVIPGSGAWSGSYHEWLPDLVRSCAERFTRVVVLPSSYDTRVPAVSAALAAPNVHPLARERRSAALVRATRPCGLSLDCAVFAGGVLATRRPAAVSRQLFALRTDLESGIPPDRYRLSSSNIDISSVATNLDAWLEWIAVHGTVVTDRAHVMLAATLMGKKVFFHEGAYWKLSELADYTFGIRRSWPRRVGLEELLAFGALEPAAGRDVSRQSAAPAPPAFASA